MPELKLKDVTLNYEVDDFTDPWLKNTETVLMHHGCGRHAGFWYQWVPVLARKYKVIRIDARGFGKSSEPGPDFRWSVEAFAGDVIALMDNLEIAQVYYVGEHLGSFVGMQLALDYPDRIRKLAISSLPYISTSSGEMIDSIEKVGMREYVLSSERLRFGGNKAYGEWFAEEFAKARSHVVKSVMQVAGNADYSSRLADIKCPVLFLLGELLVKEHDEDGKARALLREKLSRDSEVVVIKGGPWFVVYTEPETCARLSLKFFEKSVQSLL